MLLSKNQRSLHQTTLELDDGPLEGASLFPLFDDEGTTHALMLVWADSREIVLLDWSEEIFTPRLVAPGRLEVAVADLRDASGGEAEALAHLWHFDPWWVLADERFAGHPAVPPLRSTNIPGFDTSWSQAWFDRSLSRLTRVAAGKGEEPSSERFTSEHLAQAREERARQQGAQPPSPTVATRSRGSEPRESR